MWTTQGALLLLGKVPAAAHHTRCTYDSVHVYPDNWEIPVEEFDWVNVNFIQDRAALAHAAGKPIIVEEFGVRADYHPRGRCVCHTICAHSQVTVWLC